MRHLVLIVLAAVAVPGAVSAQTWGQPRYSPYGTGQPYGAPGVPAYGHGHAAGYGQPYGYGYSHGGGPTFGDPRAYRPPVAYGHRHDRGGRYGYSATARGDWTRWSSPPGRGYHDVYGYNDDRAPRGADDRRYGRSDCRCYSPVYLYDD